MQSGRSMNRYCCKRQSFLVGAERCKSKGKEKISVLKKGHMCFMEYATSRQGWDLWFTQLLVEERKWTNGGSCGDKGKNRGSCGVGLCC